MKDMRERCVDFRRLVYRFFDECTGIGWVPNGVTGNYMTPERFEARITANASQIFSEYHPDVANGIAIMLLEVLVVDGVPFRELNEKLMQQRGLS